MFHCISSIYDNTERVIISAWNSPWPNPSCYFLSAACLGRKRFPREPWGPAYEESLGLAIPQGKQAEGTGEGKHKGYDASEEVDDGWVCNQSIVPL